MAVIYCLVSGQIQGANAARGFVVWTEADNRVFMQSIEEEWSPDRLCQAFSSRRIDRNKILSKRNAMRYKLRKQMLAAAL